jgi:hypothetical protein
MKGITPPPRPDRGTVARFNPSGRRRWPLVILGFCIGVGSVLWVVGLILYVDHPGGFIGDSAFAEAANEACENAFSTFPPPSGADATFDERADAVEESHARLVALVDALGTLPVDATDRDEVAWWIARWRQFLAIGPEYAAAIRTGDRDIYRQIGDLGDEPARDVDDFARNNGIGACMI